MLKDVIISLRTLHDIDSKAPESLDFMTDGYYTYDDGVGCFTYQESEVTGMEGTRTSVFAMPDRIVVDHDGTVTSRMEFKEGEKTSFLYSLPFGEAHMGIDTRYVHHDFNENGGHAEIEYVVNVDHKFFTKNRLLMNVKQEEHTSA